MSSLVLKLKQTQQLNQRLQQSLRILQMSGLELEREVEDWLSDNPLLERPESDEFADSGLNRAVTMPRAGQQLSGDDAEDIWSNIAEEEDFKHYLHAQVCEHPLSQVEAAYVHVLIDFLDEQGYLTDSLEEIIDHTPLEWMLDEEALQNALMLQLMRLPASPARQMAAHLVQSSLQDLGKNRKQNVLRFRKLYPDTDSKTIEAALDMIAGLNPYPAYGFASATPTPYIQPDVWVKEGKDGWEVISNEAAWPKLQLNQEYCDLMKSEEEGAPEWKEKINEAKQRIDSLELRKSTVLRLAEYIVKNQEDFFIFGEIGLSPMLMKDAAAELGLAESTISRAANQKYLSCPRGLFALRYFFTQAVNADDDGEGFSQGAIKAVLSQLIESEDSSKPYSDEALVKLLKQRGIEIARRTVAKYRESLDIPPAHKRKFTE